jgi:hypothetical protein
MRFLLLLLPSIALADVTVNGSVVVTTPDGGFQLFDEHGEKLRFADHRVDTGRDVPLFRDVFVGASVSAHNKWAQSILTQTATAALRHQKQGANQSIDLRVTAAQFAKHLDLEDGKRDFTDEKIHAEVVAELHRRGL